MDGKVIPESTPNQTYLFIIQTSIKKIMNRKFLLMGLCILLGCRVTEKEAIGLYVSRNNRNTIDTLEILSNGTYVNMMYRKQDSSLIYKNINKWEIENGSVIFNDYFSDEDEIHSKEFTAYKDVLMTTKLPLEKRNGKIIIHHKPMYDEIYLEKIK